MHHINRNPETGKYQVNFVSKGRSVGAGFAYNTMQGCYGHVRSYMRHYGVMVDIIQNDIAAISVKLKLWMKGKPELAGGKPAKKYKPAYK